MKAVNVKKAVGGVLEHYLMETQLKVKNHALGGCGKREEMRRGVEVIRAGGLAKQ